MATAESFRIDPRSGLQYHNQAETLIKVNAVAGVVFLLIGGILAVLVSLTRVPGLHVLNAEHFYMVLTAHGLDMLIFWLLFFEVAILYFCSSTLLRSRLAAPRWGWLAFALMVIGAVTTNVAIFQGQSSVMMTSYAPMQAHPAFYLGLILFAVGGLIACFIFLGTLVIAKAEKTYEGSVPLVTFGALTACIIAIFTIASGAIILIPTFLWSIGYVQHIDALMYRVIWWGLGHSSQQVNVAAHISVWYAVGAIVFGAKPMSEKVSRTAFLLYILFLQLACAHHLLSDPGLSSEWKILNTSYFMYFAVLASMLHGLTVPGAMEVAQRKKGYTRGLYEWLRKAPWSNPVFSSIFLSIVGFGFLGGITGVMMGTEQLNMLIHNTIYVPGHFHATVVIGTTLAFMGLTYFLLPSLFSRDVSFYKIAQWQPYVFSIGMYGLALTMMGAGTLGVPRRHWDIGFSGTALPYEFPGAAYLMMTLMGVFAVIAFIGGGMYIFVTVWSILFGKRVESGQPQPRPTPLRMPVAEAIEGHGGGAGLLEARGTFALAMVFLVAFVLYYFINWKYLGSVWGIN